MFCSTILLLQTRVWATSPMTAEESIARAYQKKDFAQARREAIAALKHWEYVDVQRKGKLDNQVDWMTFVFSTKQQYGVVKVCEKYEQRNDAELISICNAYRSSMRHMFKLWATIPLDPTVNQTASCLEETRDYKAAASLVSKIMGKEIALLENNGQHAQAESLRKENPLFLNFPEPSYDPNGPEIVRDSHANPGPLQ